MADSAKPTIVLVHGAFADSSSWNDVTRLLRADGYPVLAVANPLRGVASDAAYVAATVAAVDGPVILVGHSYGGSVITTAARDQRNVRALVYVAGFAPDAGETAAELSGRFPGSTLGETLEEIALPDNQADVRVRQDLFHQQFAADVKQDDAELMAVAQRPIAVAALNEPSGAPAWRLLPSYHLIPTADKNIPHIAQIFMAERAGGAVVTVQDASHAVLVSQPGATAQLIKRAATETA
ncbi:alpha/beta hydrolase [Micromonospora sp. H33]|uniref:alpha/beta hydrolase n=1 Tax=Micromonospora sp. H33 TaxID=3452215 RepID=UPI003F893732